MLLRALWTGCKRYQPTTKGSRFQSHMWRWTRWTSRPKDTKTNRTKLSVLVFKHFWGVFFVSVNGQRREVGLKNGGQSSRSHTTRPSFSFFDFPSHFFFSGLSSPLRRLSTVTMNKLGGVGVKSPRRKKCISQLAWKRRKVLVPDGRRLFLKSCIVHAIGKGGWVGSFSLVWIEMKKKGE